MVPCEPHMINLIATDSEVMLLSMGYVYLCCVASTTLCRQLLAPQKFYTCSHKDCPDYSVFD